MNTDNLNIPKEDKVLIALKDWCKEEICERRDYTATKTFEVVIDKVNELCKDFDASEKPSIKENKETKKDCLHPVSQRRYSSNNREQCGVCRKYI